ncbi:histone transcription regulator HIRA, WD repeat superfamily [Polychaeton citri CBS 116435]|uniref:Protein HIR n=1 Tax=Polychaeton citri CBS 116435 TaxID=1314669 RepID=A0A9P4URQ5_9PEZI|nr:histone transcription regulator HIRA, WD repeat superfamily [Polychaeton citri CBS 116435]
MRLVKPAWLAHGGEKKDHEVYSCHVSPDGSRLVTAAGDGHVRIWSTEAILNASNPAYTKPKQLASLSYHSGTIHSVRFSGNGKYLASGADDRIVCVYTLDAGEPAHQTFGSKEEKAVENWRMYRRLIGHDNDVQDLGWSHDSSILVSVGLDSKVVVWSGTTFEKLKTLSHHQSHVKGITFDPANKYFATASDDRTIKIYRWTTPPPNATSYDQTSNFSLETTVTTPFTTSPLTTYFRRCSWSPEGAHIAAANAVNGPVSSVAIITRGSWDSDINLIGHEGPVEVCAFAPRMFTRDPPPKDPKLEANTGMAVTVVACAGQDKTVSIWNTSFPRPMATMDEIANKPISDLAWSPDGETLYATSLDGSIVALVFQTGELGYPAQTEENDAQLAKYGANRGRAGLVEGTDALRLEQGAKEGESRAVEGRMGELMGDSPATGGAAVNGTVADTPATNDAPKKSKVSEPVLPESVPPPKDPQQERVDKLKQRVQITKDGKKRITPLLVTSSNQESSNMPRPQLQAAVKSGAGSDEPAGKILDLSKPYDGLPKGGLASLLLGNKRKYAEMDDGEGGNANTKRVQLIQSQGSIPVVQQTEQGLVPAGASAARKTPAELPEVLRPAIVNPATSVAQIRLAVPMIRSVISRPADPTRPATNDNNDTDDANVNSNESLILEARNATGASRTGRVQDREPTRISLTKRTQILWQDFLPKAVLLTTGSPRTFWAVACEDGSLHLWTPAGRRLLSPIVLEAQPVILDSRGWFLMAITAIGQTYVWDVRKMKSVSSNGPISLAPILDAASMSMQGHVTAGPALMFARLSSEGKVVVGMSNGDGFCYNVDMCVWQRLSEGWWAVGSQYWNTADTSLLLPKAAVLSNATKSSASKDNSSFIDTVNPENISAGIIPLLERNTTSQSLLKGRAYFLQRLVKQLLSAEGYEGFESAVSIAHLENRVTASMMLGAKQEFRVYLVMYAKRLGAEGMKGKIEELLRGLLGGMDDQDGTTEDHVGEVEEDEGLLWGRGEDIVGWKRQDLLKEVVLVLGKHRELQRVTVPYARLLGVLQDGTSVGKSVVGNTNGANGTRSVDTDMIEA